MKFEVGQKWRDRSGDIWKITDINDSTCDTFPVAVERETDGISYYVTLTGRASSFNETEQDLVDLVPTPKKTLNFWEARQAALDGKKVKTCLGPLCFSKEEFTNQDCWSNELITADWEIVEEPKHKTCYINVYLHDLCPWGAHETRALADSGACTDRASCLAITVDENGRLIDAKNV
jgi:hypothetical protein